MALLWMGVCVGEVLWVIEGRVCEAWAAARGGDGQNNNIGEDYCQPSIRRQNSAFLPSEMKRREKKKRENKVPSLM